MFLHKAISSRLEEVALLPTQKVKQNQETGIFLKQRNMIASEKELSKTELSNLLDKEFK